MRESKTPPHHRGQECAGGSKAQDDGETITTRSDWRTVDMTILAASIIIIAAAIWIGFRGFGLP